MELYACTMNRSTFFKSLEPFLSRRQLLRIQLAYTLSKYWHRSQVRSELDSTGKPVRYFEHVRRVAIILTDELHCRNPDMIVAALLHDAIEDTRDEDLSPDMIEENFGEDVVVMIKTLSKVPKAGYVERFMQTSDWRPYFIKACDRLDNLRSMDNVTSDFLQRQIKETDDIYMPLFARMHELVPKAHSLAAIKVVHMITEQLDVLRKQLREMHQKEMNEHARQD